jgi:hypothetical protein
MYDFRHPEIQEKVLQVNPNVIFEAYEQTYEKSHCSICYVLNRFRWTDFDRAQGSIQESGGY